MPDPRIVITSGEPAGIGPDILAAIDPSSFGARLSIVGDIEMLSSRAASLDAEIEFVEAGGITDPARRRRFADGLRRHGKMSISR